MSGGRDRNIICFVKEIKERQQRKKLKVNSRGREDRWEDERETVNKEVQRSQGEFGGRLFNHLAPALCVSSLKIVQSGGRALQITEV